VLGNGDDRQKDFALRTTSFLDAVSPSKATGMPGTPNA
jgi:hypothetical protein